MKTLADIIAIKSDVQLTIHNRSCSNGFQDFDNSIAEENSAGL
jgi:hypothetical protein